MTGVQTCALPIYIVRKTFITYIRLLLEYNSNVWNPTHKYLIDKIKNVQRLFTKRITSISHLSYTERLSILELELKSLRFDIIQYYKIMNNLTLINRTDYFTRHHSQSSSRKPLSSLIKLVNSPNYLLTSFFTDQWNAGINSLQS